VPIGAVDEILLALPEKPRDPRIPVIIEIDGDRMTELGATRDLVVTPDMMDRLIREGGLRAQLQSQSLITGQLYIGLDLVPESPLELVLPPGSPYPEIPTLPTTLEQAQAKIQQVLDRLSRIDFEGFGKSLTGAVDGLSRIVNSEELRSTLVSLREALVGVRDAANALRAGVQPLGGSVTATTKELQGALQRLQKTLEKLDTLTDPQAPLVYGVTTTLRDLDEAARAVRQLAEHLDRDPGALIRGKKAP
jgi:paraquat-inducible protein B